MNTYIYNYIFIWGAKIVGWENGSICLKDTDGDKQWYLNGKRHRVDGPAIEYVNGAKSWYLDGKRHSINGPALECGKHKEWWINDRHYTKKEFNIIQSR